MVESKGGTSRDFSNEHLEQVSDHLETDDEDLIVIPEVKGLGKRHSVGSTAVNKKYKRCNSKQIKVSKWLAEKMALHYST